MAQMQHAHTHTDRDSHTRTTTTTGGYNSKVCAVNLSVSKIIARPFSLLIISLGNEAEPEPEPEPGPEHEHEPEC